VLDESGQIQLEQRVRTNAKGLREVFGELPHSRIALEIGTHSPWISRLLSELGHEVIVANARKLRLIGESRKKDDRLDAQTLARLARIDPELLYPVKHRSEQAQADLTLIRARAGLVRARTGLVNTARGLAKSYGERLRSCNVRNMNSEKAASLSPELQAALEPLLNAIESLSERIVSGPAQRSLTLWPARSPSRLATLFIESSDSFVASAAVSIATGWSAPVPGRELHPLKSSAFHGALLRQLWRFKINRLRTRSGMKLIEHVAAQMGDIKNERHVHG